MTLNKLLCLLLVLGCSNLGSKKKTTTLPQVFSIQPKTIDYSYTDQSGAFSVSRQSLLKDKSKVWTSWEYYNSANSKKELVEKSVAISTLGVLKLQRNSQELKEIKTNDNLFDTNDIEKLEEARKGEVVQVLRPSISQSLIWLEGKKYFTQLKLIPEKKVMQVSLQSPVKEWNGVSVVSFPKSKGIFCFHSQLPECLKATGFLQKAIEKKSGSLGLTIIWNSYPYHKEQYSGVKGDLFTEATVSYDGVDDDGLARFAIECEEQTLFYHFDLDMTLSKMFWVAQGISLERKF